MKKVAVLLIGMFFFVSLLPSYSAKVMITLIIDGVTIVSKVQPEIKNNRVIVPLRVISENIGATVIWDKGKVTVTKDNRSLEIYLSKGQMLLDGEVIALDAKPYIKENTTMVPLRVIAEYFDCKVSYSHNTVTIESKPLLINGEKIKAMNIEHRMTMGKIIDQLTGNAYIEQMYENFEQDKGEKIDAPQHYSELYVADIEGSYYKKARYDFIDPLSSSIQCYDLYSLYKLGIAELDDKYEPWLLHNVTTDKWFIVDEEFYQMILQIMQQADRNGFITMILNNVA